MKKLIRNSCFTSYLKRFHLLILTITKINATFGTGVVVAVGTNIGLLPCNHEEADTRIGLICTVDTDVIVILLGNFISSYPCELMLTFGWHLGLENI